MLYDLVKWLHVVGATVLFGTGLGIAFFMFASRSATAPAARLFAARTTVLADFLFTAPAVVVQPLTGILLIAIADYDWNEPWLLVSYGLYILAGTCWLPVVWLQLRMRRLIAASVDGNAPLPPAYHRLFRLWFLLGWPAFLSVLGIFYLMIAKPS